MGRRNDHRKHNFETIGSDSEMIEKVFIDRNDCIHKLRYNHRKYGHDSNTRDLLFATQGQRGIDEFDSHMERDDFDYHDNDGKYTEFHFNLGKLVKQFGGA